MQPIDWDQVNWGYFGLLVLLVLITSYIGSLVSFRRPGWGALISAALFGGIFLMWSYYPHHLPLPTSPTRTVAATPAPAPAAQPAAVPPASVPPAPAKPANPVTDITPPRQ
jgi:hypothetical protein